MHNDDEPIAETVIYQSAASTLGGAFDWGQSPPPGFAPLHDQCRAILEMAPTARDRVIALFRRQPDLVRIRICITMSEMTMPARVWNKNDQFINAILKYGVVKLHLDNKSGPIACVAFAKKGCLSRIEAQFSGARGGRPARWEKPLRQLVRKLLERDRLGWYEPADLHRAYQDSVTDQKLRAPAYSKHMRNRIRSIIEDERKAMMGNKYAAPGSLPSLVSSAK